MLHTDLVCQVDGARRSRDGVCVPAEVGMTAMQTPAATAARIATVLGMHIIYLAGCAAQMSRFMSANPPLLAEQLQFAP
jgi:hypothetical protein